MVLAWLVLAASVPVWEATDSWNDEHELSYARFIETLFADDGDASWPHLHALLRDPERNLLYDRLGKNEDNRLTLRPDCGDLVYVLRAYFAWKHGLPFRYSTCTRASAPTCRVAGDQSMPRAYLESPDAEDDVEAFARFVERHVMTTVHSSSGRTRPRAELSDFYPIPVEREALRAGSVYIDPYGHALVVAGWTAQTVDESGYLVLVDAQPDGTISRRRFWRGSPLFETDDAYGGPGFKAFRPLDVSGDASSNAELRSHNPPLSTAQHEMTRDQFYDRIDALANPAPLDAEKALHALLDGLEAQVNRRVASVARGEAFMRERTMPIEMPSGDIFMATGEWESYATPVRDWRLLIAFDVVRNFPRSVARQPERFDATGEAVEAWLDDELDRRTFDYVGSDGLPVTMTLAELIDRSRALEAAYNPNDCVEVRWGAPPVRPCDRLAPESQRARMEELKIWFRDRKRPPY